MKFQKTIIRINSIVFIVYGLGFIFFPVFLGNLITGSEPSTSSGLIDMRSTYGGMSVGLGLILGLLAREDHSVRSGLLGVIFVMAFMAASRVFGMITDGSPNLVMYLYLAAEILMLIVCTLSLFINYEE